MSLLVEIYTIWNLVLVRFKGIYMLNGLNFQLEDIFH